MAKPNGVILYEGPSAFDGAPIVCIATGLQARGSANGKTGAMIQTWILRADMAPTDAVRSGADASICADCMHRGAPGRTRTCYVVHAQAPQAVWRAYRRGRYTRTADGPAEWTTPDALARLRTLLRASGRPVRIGSYGDPAALPLTIVSALASVHRKHTGYTHQWRHYPALAPYLMASADSLADVSAARALGFRTFRTGADASVPAAREISCPASAEAGYKSECVKCGLCDGASTGDRRASIRILPHGASAVSFYKSAAAL